MMEILILLLVLVVQIVRYILIMVDEHLQIMFYREELLISGDD